ncbi:hypothetical protein C2869_01200 [Saccharobesus litoralis]|uniref:Cytochrome b561 bacterial/Ni-hydrogenase domain-containing protein n=1 Tax=Saccharobesus litoralis TaxID=2172099 RepID=A0A2S0VLR1_9ALTE|nr:cytochrome b/b6 domain-containing protein [Saccharobesus litoralis]AWB65142.1 hypothetical protein C2869_01200 [Saccharobesus litoralis]
MSSIKVWDGATRLFHWLLVVCILGAWITIENRWILAHEIFGFTLLGLIVFRLIWGFVGSTTARFSHFMTRPTTAIQYLSASLNNQSQHYTGHNPSGGWMVIGLLGILLFQVVTGLYANNDLGFSGALADNVSKAFSDQLTQWHAINFNLILAAIWLHLVAVFFYVLVKKDNLIKAMLTGRKPKNKTTHSITNNPEALKFVSLTWAISLGLVIALAIYLIF